MPKVSSTSPWMNSAPSSMGRGRSGWWRVKMRPPMRWRASTMTTCLPAPDRSRAAARPAAPAPMTTTSTLFADDLRPRQLPHRENLLVDVVLRRAVAEDSAKIIHLGGDQFVVLGEEADCGGLEIAFGHGDHLFRHSRGLIAHVKKQRTFWAM